MMKLPPPLSVDLGAVGLALVQVQADKFGDVVSSGLAGDLRRGALLDDAPAFHDDELVGEHERFDRIVGDQQGRPGEVGQVRFEFGLDVEASSGVQRGQRFIQQQQRWLPGQRAGQCHPLRLPAGQLGRLAVGEVGEPEPGHPVIGGSLGRLPSQAPRPRGEGHVLGHGQVREEPVVLEDEPDRPSGGLHEGSGIRVVHHLPRERDAAGRHGSQAGHRAEQGGLPGPVRPEQPEDLTGCRGEADGQGEATAPDFGGYDEAAAFLVRHTAEPPRSQ